MTTEAERTILTALAQAWADFDKERELRGAMAAFEALDRHDLAEVLRSAWVEQRDRRAARKREGWR